MKKHVARLLQGLWLLGGTALAVGTTGCSTEAFCFACDQFDAAGGTGGTGNAGTGGTGGTIILNDGGDADVETDAGDGGSCEGIDLQTDPQNCGTCGNRCQVEGALPQCVAGECVVDQCFADYVDVDQDGKSCECLKTTNGVEACDGKDNDCDGQIDDGIDLQTDILNCGVCNNECPDKENSTKSCVAGECTYACNDGFGRPGGSTDTTRGCPYQCPVFPTTAEACNGRDDDCDGAIDNGQPGAGVSCTDNCPNGSCIGECRPGQTACTGTGSGLTCIGGVGPAGEICDGLDNDCNGQTDEGFDFQTDELNCGQCGRTCQAGVQCVAGVCQFTCPAGFKDINGNPVDGCEYGCPVLPERAETCNGIDDDCDGTIDDAVTDVGQACATDCPAPNPCVAGGSCSPYTISPRNGTCYGVCSSGGRTACVAGVRVCQNSNQRLIETCDGRDENCDGRIDEGFSLSNDPLNCGGCGVVCQRPNTQSMACTGGTCSAIVACNPGFSDVDGNVANGCEYSCPVNPPVGESCNGRDDDCDGVVDNNVGGLGQSCTSSCPAPDPCVAAGNCTFPVSPNSGSCYGVCANDGVTNCSGGAPTCNHPNRTTESCNGQDDDCDGLVDDGFNKQTDPANCGSCGNVCNLPGVATQACAAGTCSVGTCSAGFKDLDGNATNGCEYRCPVNPAVAETCNGRDDDCDGLIDDSPSGVGVSCSSNCPGNNCRGECRPGTTACVNGGLSCQGGVGPVLETCNTKDDDCNGTVDNGFNTQTDPNNCGSCGNACSLANAVAGCTSGACTILACNPGFANTDGNVNNGCERTCEVYPTGPEVCNGKDDDCDGLVDAADSSMQTVTNFCSQTGPCAGATPSCQGTNGWRCNYLARDPRIEVQANGNVSPVETRCDGFDNNCNGQSDETFTQKGQPCLVGNGICAGNANYTCKADGTGVECLASPDPTKARDEACNGKDDNCDGNVDERTPTGSLTCYDAGGGNPHPCVGWRDPMVKLTGNVWVYAYEASRIDADSSESGVADGRACSVDNKVPWSSVNRASAAAACAAVRNSAGNPMRLCTEAEWEQACLAGNAANTADTWSYSANETTYSAGVCNDSDAATPAGVWLTGQGPQCYADWGGTNRIFDMSGNLSEWTSTSTTVNGTTYNRVRGGSTVTLAGGTTCEFDFVLQQQTFKNFDLGFRCCSDAAP